MQRYDGFGAIATTKSVIIYLLLALWLIHSGNAQPKPMQMLTSVRKGTIPIEVQHNLILIPVRVNGSAPVYFILDTGVRNTLLIEPTILQLMGVSFEGKLGERTQVRGLGDNNYIEALKIHGISLSVANVIGSDSADITLLPDGAISYTGMFDRPIMGIIGSDIFTQFVVKINYTEKYITLYQPNQMPKFSEKKWHVAPIVLENAKPYAQAAISIAANDSPALRQWLLDTGASSALLLFDASLPLPRKTLPSTIGIGLGGTLHGALGKVLQLQFANTFPPEKTFPPLQAPIVGFPDTGSIAYVMQGKAYYANIGAEILSRFHIVFDYPHRRVFLRPNNAFRKAFSYNYSGIELVKNLPPSFNALSIKTVREHSPAAMAGFQAGDVLKSINGTSVEDFSVEMAYGLLHDRPNRQMCIEVERNGSRLRKCMLLIDELSDLP